MVEPRLSIVMPVLNEESLVEHALSALQNWRACAELIVVDGGSDDATVSRARPLCDQCLGAPTGRARQMNAGAARSRGDFLLFLHCDTALPPTPETVLSQLDRDFCWGFFPVRLSGADWRLRVIERAMNLRARLTRVATGDQCLVVNRATWEAEGGFADIPLMEDVEFSKRLRRRASPRLLSPTLHADSRRWETHGIARTVLTMWRLRLAYWLGADPVRLHRRYYG